MPWAQYDITTGIICGTNTSKVDDSILAPLNRAQVEVPSGVDGSVCMIDLVILQPILLPPDA